MKVFRALTLILAIGVVGLAGAGCGGRKEKGHNHSHGNEQAGKPDEHGHEEEAPSGASFKPGKGVILTDETRQSLGLKTTEVSERNLAFEIRFTVQVFGENHKSTAPETYHADCTAKAAGLLAQDKATQVRPGAPVSLASQAGESMGGVVLGVDKALAIGDVEVIVGVTNSGARLTAGDFLSASVSISREQPFAVIPKAAVLQTAEGRFVYVLNGNAYLRTPVKTGAEAAEFVEITDGLFSGDMVVTNLVERLWLIELRATKGGGHSH